MSIKQLFFLCGKTYLQYRQTKPGYLLMSSDETLWVGLLRGDREMFLSLYKKYYHSLLFIGLREIRDTYLVKDTIQQLFLYLWEKRENLGIAKNVKSYLISSFLRKLSADWKQAGRTSNLQIVHSEYAADHSPTPEECLIRKDEQQHLYGALVPYLNELPNRQRELIILKFYHGLSYDELVGQTGLSYRTVYNKIHEGLKKLKLEISVSGHADASSLLIVLGIFISCLPG
jgi:RNA polymerase sigma factor (sigma-70 family)